METNRTWFPILGVPYIGMATKSCVTTARYLCDVWGFEEFAYAGIQTGRKLTESRVLRQGDIRIVVDGALKPNSLIAEFVRKHGDGVIDMPWQVPSIDEAYRMAMARGANSFAVPMIVEKDKRGNIIYAHSALCGPCEDFYHTLIENNGYTGVFAPGFVANVVPRIEGPVVGLKNVDHAVINERFGQMRPSADYYMRNFDFTTLADFEPGEISDKYQTFASTVVQDPSGKVTIPINEQEPNADESHIDEFLKAYHGAGIQHLAFGTDDIVKSVRAAKARGARFLAFPRAYYDQLLVRFPDLTPAFVEELAELGILFDRDKDGDLLQIFSVTITERGTLFFELIERRGSRGFGKGNFKALFDAKELEKVRNRTIPAPA